MTGITESEGNDADAISIVELQAPDIAGSYFGVGIHKNSTTASILAALSAYNSIPHV